MRRWPVRSFVFVSGLLVAAAGKETCWGANTLGQLRDGSAADCATSVEVNL
jgi:hypothetical protein